MTPDALVKASRALGELQPFESYPWLCRRMVMPADGPANSGLLPGDPYMVLQRATVRWIHVGGEVVMEDTPREVRRHLPILIPARGRVLVTGLGLGCVVRGLLAKPEVEHVDVVEIDQKIIDNVWPSLECDRASIHHGDALKMDWPSDAWWDFGWHDIWTEDDSLQLLHAGLMLRYHDQVGRQGCWQFPRWLRAIIRRRGRRVLEGRRS